VGRLSREGFDTLYGTRNGATKVEFFGQTLTATLGVFSFCIRQLYCKFLYTQSSPLVTPVLVLKDAVS